MLDVQLELSRAHNSIRASGTLSLISRGPTERRGPLAGTPSLLAHVPDAPEERGAPDNIVYVAYLVYTVRLLTKDYHNCFVGKTFVF